MTIRDYIDARLKQWGAKILPEIVDSAFALAQVQPTDVFNNKSEYDSFRVLYKLIPDFIISVPNSMSEGGFSVSYDKNSMTAFYSMIASKLGLPDELSGKGRVKDITNKWQ